MTSKMSRTETTMTACVQARYGDDLRSLLRPASVPVPAPGDGEVLVRVAAAAVNRAVWHLSTGRPYVVRAGFGLRRPKQPIPGMDMAGTVVAVGTGVTGFAPGDEVFGDATGAYAEYAVAPTKALAPRPAAFTATQAATLPISGSTALEAVRDHARVAPGERVLITGASGGVGLYAVQLAVAAGATVTGIASAAKSDLVYAAGATTVLDYRRVLVTAAGTNFDVIIDTAGNNRLRSLRSMLTPTGRLVIVGGEQAGSWIGGIDRQGRAAALNPFVGQKLIPMFSRTTTETLTSLATAYESGDIQPSEPREYDLDDAGRALEDLHQGAINGHAVVAPS